MKINNLNYYITQAFKSFRKNKLMSIASVTTTFASLFILGIFILLTLNVNHWAEDFSRSCQIQVFVDENLTDKEYDAVNSKILKIPAVEKTEKYTKEQIFEEMRVKLKDKAEILTAFETINAEIIRRIAISHRLAALIVSTTFTIIDADSWKSVMFAISLIFSNCAITSLV